MMAIVDAKTLLVHEPTLANPGSLHVKRDNLSSMDVDMRPESQQMVLRNACRDYVDRKTCNEYSFEWVENKFRFLRFVMRGDGELTETGELKRYPD